MVVCVPDTVTDADRSAADLVEPGAEPAPRGPVTAASDRLTSTVVGLDTSAWREPSLCPAWTRAHLVTHLARNADSLTNLLSWARTGEPTYQYPSSAARNADIETGASRAHEEIIEDLATATARFAQTVVDLPDHAWTAEVRVGPAGAGQTIPARRVMWMRLMEVEVHHVDLAAGYSPADWPEPFVHRVLAETLGTFRRRDDVPALTLDIDGRIEVIRPGGPTVAGPAPAVLAWLIGRADGTSLTSDQPLPALPDWK